MKEDMEFLQGLIEQALAFLQVYSLQVAAALVIIALGVFASRWISRVVSGLCRKRNIDQTLSEFLGSVTGIVIMAFTVIIALGKFGITITPLIATLGAAVFGMTFAIQAPIANFTAGLVILVIRPFKIGDTISILERYGVVEHIKVAQTVLVNEDGERIYIPNKHIVGEVITNSEATRLLESSIGVAYSTNPSQAVSIVGEALSAVEGIDTERKPLVGIEQFADSSVVIAWRCRVHSSQYHALLYETNQRVFEALVSAGIEIPFPQRVVTMRKGEGGNSE